MIKCLDIWTSLMAVIMQYVSKSLYVTLLFDDIHGFDHNRITHGCNASPFFRDIKVLQDRSL